MSYMHQQRITVRTEHDAGIEKCQGSKYLHVIQLNKNIGIMVISLNYYHTIHG